MSQPAFSINWAKLHNELFAAICSDPQLRARYEAADSEEAQEICADQLDRIVCDAGDFLERFIVLAQRHM